MRTLAVATLASMLTGAGALAQKPPIQAKDGDVIEMDAGARVRLVRRADGNLRVVFNAAQGTLLIIVDSAAAGAGPDGRVDTVFSFTDVRGEWPLGDRWEGTGSVEEYLVAGELGNAGVRLVTPNGSAQLLSTRGGAEFRDRAGSAALSYAGGGRSGGGGMTFDQAESQHAAIAARNAEARAGRGIGPAGGFIGGVVGGVVGGGVGGVQESRSGYPPPGAPVRVGGTIRTPMKIQDAAPAMPETAQQAGVRGVVILEIVIGVDGRVTDAKVLRSIPLLDQAALDAVRQWRYEPTLLNGAPVPVIMTVTVNFL